jgi:CheY-like chemotaxis protein
VLLNLINDILDFSKIEAGRLDILKGYFSLPEMLDYLRNTFDTMFQSKDLEFVCEFSPELPRILYGDEKRIRQILTNLLNNAFKYTKEGTVIFRAYGDEPSGDCYFEVEDSGIGIKEDDVHRLFRAFEQLDQIKNRKVGGTGLGLAITKKLCELMEGEISVKSSYGRGSCFSVRLPLPQGTEEDIFEDADDTTSFITKGVRALVVDDIEINVIISAAMLESYGIASDAAYNGRQAIEKAKSLDYDIIFMDHMMPEMDGVEATKELRALGGALSEIPIVALTANAVSGAANMFLTNGFSGFLTKPIDPGELSKCLLLFLPREKVHYQL